MSVRQIDFLQSESIDYVGQHDQDAYIFTPLIVGLSLCNQLYSYVM